MTDRVASAALRVTAQRRARCALRRAPGVGEAGLHARGGERTHKRLCARLSRHMAADARGSEVTWQRLDLRSSGCHVRHQAPSVQHAPKARVTTPCVRSTQHSERVMSINSAGQGSRGQHHAAAARTRVLLRRSASERRFAVAQQFSSPALQLQGLRAAALASREHHRRSAPATRSG